MAVVTISRPDICSAASEPSSGTVIRGVAGPGSSKGNSSSRAPGSRSKSSRRSWSIPAWLASCHCASARSYSAGSSGAGTNTRTISCPGPMPGSSPCSSSTARCTAPAANRPLTVGLMTRSICSFSPRSPVPPLRFTGSTRPAGFRFRGNPAARRITPRNVSGLCWNNGVATVIYSPVQLARLLRLPEPTPEQAAVIAAPLGPLAVVAGAGSGKSETMAARLVWLVANGMVRPDRVLGLTFTRKAAAEFADRVRSRLERLRRAGLAETKPAGTDDPQDPFAGDPVIGTYHAYAGRLVGDNALREGLEPSMRLITPALSWQLAASIVAAYNGPMDEIIWTPQTVTAAVLELAGDLSEHLRETGDVTAVGRWLTAELGALPGRVPGSVRKIIGTQRAREQLLPLVERYVSAKAAREALDNGDQVALAARIAGRHPEVAAAERARYHVVLLDEYQDTSHAQLVLLRSLFGGGHPVTAVGDPCQSIYGWRGASAGNLSRFKAEFPVVARMRPFGASG